MKKLLGFAMGHCKVLANCSGPDGKNEIKKFFMLIQTLKGFKKI